MTKHKRVSYYFDRKSDLLYVHCLLIRLFLNFCDVHRFPQSLVVLKSRRRGILLWTGTCHEASQNQNDTFAH